jgi:hypothetical protein
LNGVQSEFQKQKQTIEYLTNELETLKAKIAENVKPSALSTLPPTLGGPPLVPPTMPVNNLTERET